MSLGTYITAAHSDLQPRGQESFQQVGRSPSRSRAVFSTNIQESPGFPTVPPQPRKTDKTGQSANTNKVGYLRRFNFHVSSAPLTRPVCVTQCVSHATPERVRPQLDLLVQPAHVLPGGSPLYPHSPHRQRLPGEAKTADQLSTAAAFSICPCSQPTSADNFAAELAHRRSLRHDRAALSMMYFQPETSGKQMRTVRSWLC